LVDNLRPPSEGGEPINDHVSAEVKIGVVSVGDGAPWPEVDVEAVELEVAPLRAHHLVAELDGGELDEELFREVRAHHQLRLSEAELAAEDVFNVGAAHPRRSRNHPGDDSGVLPIQSLTVEVIGGGNEA
jgi:hypothetical protein